ncbi:unnamed protein product [Amoebophrya sp. A25]|nr:unnamed protein product [Amoebophrya sp. A25]|eukprot:GSA25T00002606001.1
MTRSSVSKGQQDPPQLGQLFQLIDAGDNKAAVKLADQSLEPPKAKKNKVAAPVLSEADAQRVRILKSIASFRLAGGCSVIFSNVVGSGKAGSSVELKKGGGSSSSSSGTAKDHQFADIAVLTQRQEDLSDAIESMCTKAFPVKSYRAALLLEYFFTSALHCCPVLPSPTKEMQQVTEALEQSKDAESSVDAQQAIWMRYLWAGQYQQAQSLAMKLYSKWKHAFPRFIDYIVLSALLQPDANLGVAERLLEQRNPGELPADLLAKGGSPELIEARRERFRHALFQASILYRKDGPEKCMDFLSEQQKNGVLLMDTRDVNYLCASVLLSRSTKSKSDKGVEEVVNQQAILDLLKPLDSAKKLRRARQAGYRYVVGDDLSSGSTPSRGLFVRLLASLVQQNNPKLEALGVPSAAADLEKQLPAKAREILEKERLFLTISLALLCFPENSMELRAFLVAEDLWVSRFLPLAVEFVWQFCLGPDARGKGGHVFLEATVKEVLYRKSSLGRTSTEHSESSPSGSSPNTSKEELDKKVPAAVEKIFVNVARYRFPKFDDLPFLKASIESADTSKIARDDLLFVYGITEAERILKTPSSSNNAQEDKEQQKSAGSKCIRQDEELVKLREFLESKQSQVEAEVRRCSTLAILVEAQRSSGSSPSGNMTSSSSSSSPSGSSTIKAETSSTTEEDPVLRLFNHLEIKNILLSSRVTACVLEHLFYQGGAGNLTAAEVLRQRVCRWHSEQFHDLDTLMQQSVDSSANPDRLAESLAHGRTLQRSLSLAHAKLIGVLLQMHHSGITVRPTWLHALVAMRKKSGGKEESKATNEETKKNHVGKTLPYVALPPWSQTHAAGVLNEVFPAPSQRIDADNPVSELLPLILPLEEQHGQNTICEGLPHKDGLTMPAVLQPDLEQKMRDRLLAQQILFLAECRDPDQLENLLVQEPCASSSPPSADSNVKQEEGGKIKTVLLSLARALVHALRQDYERVTDELSESLVGEETGREHVESKTENAAGGGVARPLRRELTLGLIVDPTYSKSETPEPLEKSETTTKSVASWPHYWDSLVPTRLLVLLAQLLPKSKNKKTPLGVLRSTLRSFLSAIAETEQTLSKQPTQLSYAYARRARQIREMQFKP